MGIRSWFGRSEPEAPAPPRPGPPTEDQLLGALDRVEQQARDGQVPGVVLSRLLRVTRIVRDTVPRLADLGIGSTQGYSVMATATDYLPVAIGNYLRLPRDWADTRPIAGGKSSVMLLVDQLDLLGATMDKVYDAVLRSDAEAIIVHGQFLEQKFGAGSGGGSLGLDAPDPTPQTLPNGPGSQTFPGRLAPPE
ncbi:hypothetical protein N864_08610 [Intrasporangium chromatireducens Q5-1]|uniref:Uncharacterized protein n=1 Tax=Intrasporangium chromatireducens Q5-1 TaxID=584657 RepID=W9GFT6_9MICO|nr:hypothetical protein [Intrasporangium chromatireducens]EWT04930.1 hypothetical protein N864_08610 [Intrasporangium chromatireducens Q5-1]